MDDRRFDNLAKSLARVDSRRQMVKRIGGLAAVAVGLKRRPVAGAASCRTDGRTCRENADCCSLYCNPPTFIGHQRLCGPAPTTTTSTTTSTTTTAPCVAFGDDCVPGGEPCCSGFFCNTNESSTTGFSCGAG
jgi:hypothetical protein